MLSLPATEDYAAFLDLSVAQLSSYHHEALTQGRDLMWLATQMVEDPTDADELRLLHRGIMSVAEAMEVSKGYRSLSLSPFTSETIGSYSYEKLGSIVRRGVPIGLMWFDLAVSYFYTETDIVNTGKALFEIDEALVEAETSDGRTALLGPGTRSRLATSAFELPGVD